MITFRDMKEHTSKTEYLGQKYKELTDHVVQQTFYNDLATRPCYLYDYSHDNHKKQLHGYDPTDTDKKVKVWLKVMIAEYATALDDFPQHQIMFEPDVWNEQSCVPDWWKAYADLDIDFPVGLYVDIPDDRGVYHKWLVVNSDSRNLLPKFVILRCDYVYQWVTWDDGVKTLHQMCGVQRIQQSYSSGVSTGNMTKTVDNQDKFILPYNNDSISIFYNTRMIISMPNTVPLTFKVTKIDNLTPRGLIIFTLVQDEFDSIHDFIDYDNKILCADYYRDSVIKPVEPVDGKLQLKLSAVNDVLKIGGSAKRIQANIFDADNNNITSQYTTGYQWNFFIGDQTVNNFVVCTASNNQCSVKFIGSEKDYLNKILTVKCQLNDWTAELKLQLKSL